MWIPELDRDLSGRLLAIWEGTSGLPPAEEERYRALWRGRPVPSRAEPVPASSPAVALPVLPCAHRGPPLSDDEKADRDVYQLWDAHWCRHPRRPLGEAPCPCQGCGPRCPGYAPAP